ncbi:MAG TPA: catalase [Polyangiaceae bacterium]
MPNKPTTNGNKKAPTHDGAGDTGSGGELHQTSATPLTTDQGIPISDDQNSLRAGPRGPTLLEDFVLREKITHFDHERIPERIVHARGSGAHGYFELDASMAKYTTADFLQKKGTRTPVFARFSTVAGGSGSVDLPRDVRGFAVKFYTQQGNFDLVGNNIPVFFIQDAIKFPDLIHAAKMEPDRGFPQAGTAHDTFWDFISLMPESTHMIMWAMSDRAIPRSLRMMEGFGIHTFRLVDAHGKATFVKFHWRPTIGSQSVLWDEAVKISGADPDFHRRDLHDAIAAGRFPEWELSFQLFTDEQAATFDFDVLDSTKLIPEELVPLTRVGRMVLDRNPDNFFAETEQVAFCPANIVPGIDFSDDPLLQGRLFSYLDTQLSRLGSPNFHELPINAPKCPMHNFQRDGHMRTTVAKGRVAYEPSTLEAKGPRELPATGYRTFKRDVSGPPVRERSPSFADHFSQATLFFRSQTEPEQNHIVAALVFELGKVETLEIRTRMVSQLVNVDAKLARRVADGLGMPEVPPAAPAAMAPKKLAEPSPALSLIAKARATLETRVVGCLVTDGADAGLVDQLRKAVEAEGARFKIVAPKAGGVSLASDRKLAADFAIAGGPSVFFDAVVLAVSTKGAAELARESAAIDFVRDAFGHLKVIGYTAAARPLLAKAGIEVAEADRGLVALDGPRGDAAFVSEAKKGRVWEREPGVRTVY